MMHGDRLQGDEVLIDEHVEHFVVQLQGFFARIDHLDAWATACVEENLKVLGFPAGEEIGLARYLEEGRQLDKETAFTRLCEHFAAPGAAEAPAPVQSTDDELDWDELLGEIRADAGDDGADEPIQGLS